MMGEETHACPVCHTLHALPVAPMPWPLLEAKLDALETLMREVRHALRAGAVGDWR